MIAVTAICWQIKIHGIIRIIRCVTVNVDMNSKFEGTITEKWINGLSALTLESYLVQFLAISGLRMLRITFPLNILLCLISVIVCSWILKQTVNMLNRLPRMLQF